MTPEVLSLSGRCERSDCDHAIADLTLGILHRDLSQRPLHEDDEGDDDQRHRDNAENHEGRHLPGAPELERLADRRGQARHDAGKDDERDAIADAPRGDLLAEPHQEDGAAGQRDHRRDAEEPAGVEHHAALPLETDCNAIGLQRRQQHRAIARVLVHLLAALLSLLLELLEMGRHRRHQLNDDRRRDIGHDVERKDRHPAERAAGQPVDPAQNARRILLHQPGELDRIDPRNGNVGAQAIDDQRTEREPDALLEILGLRERGEIDVCCKLFRCGCHILPLAFGRP